MLGEMADLRGFSEGLFPEVHSQRPARRSAALVTVAARSRVPLVDYRDELRRSTVHHVPEHLFTMSPASRRKRSKIAIAW
jgi:hypothetical protein